MSSNSPTGGRATQFDLSLLQPIVRSKRTPIACTECRRRQVKCSGTSPRCERCHKKNIECTYMSLSEQRAVGGSISRSGTPASPPQGMSSGHAHSHSHSSRISQAPAGWQAGGQGYPAGTAYPAAPQGWRANSPAPSSIGQYTQGTQVNQTYAGVPMAYHHGYTQQSGYAQAGNAGQGGGELYAQGYAQPGYAGETSYNAYAQGVAATDPRYAYQAAQMAAMSGDPQNATYVAQYAEQQQVYFDPTTGHMISADIANQWTDNNTTGYQGQPYPGQN